MAGGGLQSSEVGDESKNHSLACWPLMEAPTATSGMCGFNGSAKSGLVTTMTFSNLQTLGALTQNQNPRGSFCNEPKPQGCFCILAKTLLKKDRNISNRHDVIPTPAN